MGVRSAVGVVESAELFFEAAMRAVRAVRGSAAGVAGGAPRLGDVNRLAAAE